MRQLKILAVFLCLLVGCASKPVEPNPPRDFGRWEKEISAFEQADRQKAPPMDAVLFTGSSTIRLWKTLEADFPNYRVINRGFGGCQIEDCTHFADRIIFPYKPKMVLIRAGGNDINDGKSPERVFEDFKDFVKKVHSKLPETDVVFISMSPSIARWEQRAKNKAANDMIERYARRTPHVKYIDTYTLPLAPDGHARPELFVADKLHFSPAGYTLLAERVRTVLPR